MAGHKKVELGSLTKLIIDAKLGSPKAQEELCERFKFMIRSMARSMNKNDVEDAQQELIYELLLAAKRFKPSPTPETQDF